MRCKPGGGDVWHFYCTPMKSAAEDAWTLTPLRAKLQNSNAPPHFDAKAFLSYYYYGGMIYAALKDYDRALYFFEVVLTTPATAVSSIMVEAYKKYVIIGLMKTGKEPKLPSYRSPVVQRNIKPQCQPYTDLIEAVTNAQSSNVTPLAAVRELLDNKHRAVYAQDNNTGLVKLLVDSMVRANIKRLTSSFLTLSLVDVANRCKLSGGPVEAEHYLVSMIAENQICATIDHSRGMVSFQDRVTLGTQKDLAASIEECLQLEAKLRALDTETLLNPTFVSKSGRMNVGSGVLSHDDEGFGGAAAGTSDMMLDFLSGM